MLKAAAFACDTIRFYGMLPRLGRDPNQFASASRRTLCVKLGSGQESASKWHQADSNWIRACPNHGWVLSRRIVCKSRRTSVKSSRITSKSRQHCRSHIVALLFATKREPAAVGAWCESIWGPRLPSQPHRKLPSHVITHTAPLNTHKPYDSCNPYACVVAPDTDIRLLLLNPILYVFDL